MRYLNFFSKSAMWILALGVIIGCSGGGSNPVAPFDKTENTISEPQGERTSERTLWGFWELHFDPVEMSVSAKPLRTALPHFDITDHILPPACDDCFSIGVNGFNTTKRILDADVTLRNPLAISGRDVRGILFTNQYGHLVTNANGWTELWDIPNGEDINPFRAFAKDEQNRVFAGGTEHIENYLIYIPQPPNYWAIQFAVDAFWPTNCKEPYEIGDLHSNFILYDYPGAEAQFLLDVFDWQDDIDSVKINAVEITSDESTSFTHVSGNVWTVNLSNLENAVAGDYRCLVTSTSANSTIPLYQYVTVTIHETPVPTVTSIEPDNGVVGETNIDVTVVGTNFYGPTAQVILRKIGEPGIVAENVLIISLTEISCNLGLPWDAAFGLYDVEVINGLGKSGLGVEMFEIEQPFIDVPFEITPPGLNFSPLALCASGNYVYMACGSNGLHVFDISDPLFTIDPVNEMMNVAVIDNIAYICDYGTGLRMFQLW